MMEFLWTVLGIAALLLLLCAAALIYCFTKTFYSKTRIPPKEDEYPIPHGAVYEPHRPAMTAWIREVRAMPCEHLTVTTPDGLTLRGCYYHHADGAPIEIMFPGYRGNAERDLCGGVQRCFALGHNALIVDQRAGGRSDGHVISFGVNESRDCLLWIDRAIAHFGQDCRLILTGISMGAATVMMAAGEPLPPQVMGVLADCGYTGCPVHHQKSDRGYETSRRPRVPVCTARRQTVRRF